MQLVKNLLDKPLISLNEGRIIGTVKAILFTPDWKAVVGVSLNAEKAPNWSAQGLAASLGAQRLFNVKTSLILQSDITLFGLDALLVRQTGVIIDSAQASEFNIWQKPDDLKGRAIETPGGTKIGTLGDVIINSRGKVLGFQLSQWLIQGTLAQRGYISRQCVVDLLTSNGLMTIDLAQAEQQILTDEPFNIDLRKVEEAA